MYRHFKLNYTHIQLRTRQYIAEDSELHTHRRENLKSHSIESDYELDNRAIKVSIPGGGK
jgi:hypothetical protein